MKTSENGIALIKLFESFRSKPYLCPSFTPTIGYGTTKYPDNRKVLLKDSPVTEEKACEYLADDLIWCEGIIDFHVKPVLNQNQFDALVSFVYNLGSGNFCGSTLLQKLNAGDFAGAAAEFDKWVWSTGKKLAGLERRRKAEKELFLTAD